MAKINSLSDATLAELKRELQQMRNDTSNLRRHLAHVGARHREAVWLPASTQKVANRGSTVIKKYQPVMLYGPEDGSDNPLQSTSFNRNNVIWQGSALTNSSDALYLWNKWGVAQEEIAVDAIGDVIVEGLTPVRILYDAADDGSSYLGVFPVEDQNYCRIARTGPAKRYWMNTTAADADGIIIDYCHLGKGSLDVGLSASSVHGTPTVTLPTTVNEIFSVWTAPLENGCHLKRKSIAGTSLTSSGYGLTLNSGTFEGVEAIDKIYVVAKASAFLYGDSLPSSDSAAKYSIDFVKFDSGLNQITDHNGQAHITANYTHIGTIERGNRGLLSASWHTWLEKGELLFPVIKCEIISGGSWIFSAKTRTVEYTERRHYER